MAGYQRIKHLSLNDTEQLRVNEIMESLLTNGWIGAPILYIDDMCLVTGSHRLEALKQIESMYDVSDDETQDKITEILNADIALDVTDIVNEYCEENDCTYDQLPFDSLRNIFKNTRIEEFKGEINEW